MSFAFKPATKAAAKARVALGPAAEEREAS